MDGWEKYLDTETSSLFNPYSHQVRSTAEKSKLINIACRILLSYLHKTYLYESMEEILTRSEPSFLAWKL